MEILPCEEVERVTGAKIPMLQIGDTCIQQSVSPANNSPYT